MYQKKDDKFFITKKLFLSVVFVFTAGTVMNAAIAVVDEVVVMDCITMAFDADKKANLSYEQFVAAVDACEANQ